MYRKKDDRFEKRNDYDYSLQNFTDGFGNLDFDKPYWIGLKSMKKITDHTQVDFSIDYKEGHVWRNDRLFNFKITDDEFRMTYDSYQGNEAGGELSYDMKTKNKRKSTQKLNKRENRNPKIFEEILKERSIQI